MYPARAPAARRFPSDGAPPILPIDATSGVNMANTNKPSWRDLMPVHPAADIFPMLDDASLVALGNDIVANGLITPITVMGDDRGENPVLLDGRNRLAALERVGVRLRLQEPTRGRRPKDAPTYRTYTLIADDGALNCDCGMRDALDFTLTEDPVAYIASANLHRRHLDAETKRRLVANLLKESPERSDRQTADIAKVDHKTVGSVRREMEATGELPQLTKRRGKDGKARSANRRDRAGDKVIAARSAPAKARQSPNKAAEPAYSRGKDAVRARVLEALNILVGGPSAHEVASYFDEQSDDALLVRERLPTARTWLNNFTAFFGRDERFAQRSARRKPIKAEDWSADDVDAEEGVTLETIEAANVSCRRRYFFNFTSDVIWKVECGAGLKNASGSEVDREILNEFAKVANVWSKLRADLKQRTLSPERRDKLESMPLNEQVNRLICKLSSLVDDYSEELKTFLDAHPDIDRDGKDFIGRELLREGNKLMDLERTSDVLKVDADAED
jgi:hypothetical protein